MTITITRKYLIFPTNPRCAVKTVTLSSGSTLLYDFTLRLDNIAPTFPACVDVSRFIGQTLTLAVEPDMPLFVEQADEMPLDGLWDEPLRPQVHFTVKNGWNNDPNGLIFHDGYYHMFFQYNPCAAEWGNMHWGHAVSRDLLHWAEQDIALFPDAHGTMYSGAAITDTAGLAGLGDGAMLLYYTAAGGRNLLSRGQPSTQCLAYSTDGGKTFAKHPANPILPHIEGRNRDPKVIWVEEMRTYVMALYLAEDRYALLRSDDLLAWTQFQTIRLPGDSECPDLYVLPCGDERLWVFSGASDFYLVGRFTADGFVPAGEPRHLTGSKVSYAAQSFSGIPDGRVIRFWWDRLGAPGDRFSQQMSIPTEMHLEEEAGVYHLCAAPIRELESLYRGGETLTDYTADTPVRLDTGHVPLDLTLELPWCDAVLTLDLFGTQLVCDMPRNQLTCGNDKIALRTTDRDLSLRLIIDRCSLEIFADGGRICLTRLMLCDPNLPRVILSADRPVRIGRLAWHALASIHGDGQ